MISVFHCSKLFHAKEIAAHPFIHGKKLFLIAVSERSHYFSSFIASKHSSNYTVSYLVNTCGLSPEAAKCSSKKVKFKNPQKPNSVVELLKNYGFNRTQLSILVRRFPFILLYDPEKTLLPKLNFYKSIGVSDIGRVLSSNPNLLLTSLENQLIPTYKFLKSVVGSDKKMVNICEHSSWVVYSRNIIPNITFLREFTVPSSGIELLLNNYPLSIIQKQELFQVAVRKVKEMGFDPSKSAFVQAVRVLAGKGNKLIWDRCSETYKKWGWSEDDILSAFKKNPSCMILSEKKIEGAMGFLVDKFGCQSKMVANFPAALCYSLEKRIIPRCLVIEVLSSKGLIKKMSLRSILLPPDKHFLKRFVIRYEVQLPQLMAVYRGGADIIAL